jgi:pimeloyl-ACP methyl ester carboxylesterase
MVCWDIPSPGGSTCLSWPSSEPVTLLLLWGSRDPAVPLASAHELRRALKNAELVVIQGAGHLPYEEAPAEFNRALAGFLMRGSPAARIEVTSAT